ncbi:hypothetical protein LOC67_23450 [Stieleria sp. JC731]|uniref:hypothetical protein n=1 Tax=Pirellulaceae TaxID=2691357 RepID=UPI001E4AFC5E|nr:hypothetical protein [Stieleria sp. JC731]MCC9603516.1 hypothetical protein [Stieleria sp. JC731]
MQVDRDATELILFIKLVDDSNDPIEDVEYDDTDLVIKYIQPGDSAFTTVTLVEGTLGAYVANSFVQVTSNIYQFCPPDSWVVDGSFTMIQLTYADGKPQEGVIYATASGDQITYTSVIESDPSYDSESGEITWVRGDDYVVTNNRQIDIDISGSTAQAGDTAYCKFANTDKSVSVSANASVVDVNGAIKLRIQAPRSVTSAADAGTYAYDAEVVDSDGLVCTHQSGPLRLIESWTDIVASS